VVLGIIITKFCDIRSIEVIQRIETKTIIIKEPFCCRIFAQMSKNNKKEELLAADYFQMVINTSTNNRQVQTWSGMQHRVIIHKLRAVCHDR
jgi:hypothetical protein